MGKRLRARNQTARKLLFLSDKVLHHSSLGLIQTHTESRCQADTLRNGHTQTFPDTNFAG